MSKRKKRPKPMSDKINCFNCGHCIYIGEGDYICGMSNDVILEEFAMLTDEFYQCDGKDYIEL